ncbi:MAG TPA: calcium/sodium antiporter [Candidatus Faecalibacterium faecipullorum]|uniref:Calcium/sodium antiporter n=1 Tax=Candidatus Faecalibacterium faecipullorum TaxID=2838578 RepID=A0A9D2S7K0_9FIRM|nr:calcium/sodium antiporter [Candidatus Faecalibacterium faecipullorum]
MLAALLWFCAGLFVLVKGGDWFVDGAVGIARKFRLPDLLIGATVVSVGTTLPEVMISASSALAGHGEIAYGNAVGSIICNAALVAAITIAVRPGKADGAALRLPAAFFFAAAAFFAAVAYTAGWFSRWVGAALLALFAAYLAAQILQARRGPAAAPDAAPGEAEGESPLRRDLLGLAVGAVLIAVGADLMVDNGILIAAALGVPESVIALTVVALGTSLPELTTAITSLVRGHGALSLGNVVGANLFDLVLVCGVSAALAPFGLPADAELLGRSASLVLDLPVMFLVMLLLVVPPLRRGRLYRWQGAALLAVYAAYCAVQFLL